MTLRFALMSAKVFQILGIGRDLIDSVKEGKINPYLLNHLKDILRLSTFLRERGWSI